MKHLLCVIGQMDAGGAETFMMKIYRAVNRNKYQIDFCVSGDGEGFYDAEIEMMGGQIYHITRKTKSIPRYVWELASVVHKGGYERVLRIGADCFSVLDLWIAFFAGAKVRIMRSSNAGTVQKGIVPVLHKLLRVPMTAIANRKIAPSDLAGEFAFGKRAVKNRKVIFLHNALDTQAYRFDSGKREKIRREWNMEDAFLVGHIGRFNRQKNHAFLVDVFWEIWRLRSDARLVLVGKGELEDEVKEKLYKMGLQKYVLFAGIRGDVADILSALDVFVFPSLFEGMPNTVIEAQTSGLPCLIADTITHEAKVTDAVTFASLQETASSWAGTAIQISGGVSGREAYSERMQEQGYEIENCAEEFVKLAFGED